MVSTKYRVDVGEERKMECKDILNLIAIIVIPITVVLIGQWLQNRSEKRKDKMQIFKILMTARIYGWTVESVHALNVIDIVFADDKKVRTAWEQLHNKYCVENPTQTQLEQIKMAQYKLLEEISNSVCSQWTCTAVAAGASTAGL